MAEDTINATETAQDNTNADSSSAAAPQDTATQTEESTTTPTGEETTPAKETGEDAKFGDDFEAGDKPPADAEGKDGDKEADKDEPTGAPESYEAFTLESGADIGYKISDDQLSEFNTVAKELNMSQENAQKLVDFDIKREQARIAASQKSVEDGIVTDKTAIRKKYGEKFNDAHTKFKKAVEAFMPKELQETFVEAGFDYNPFLFDMLVSVGSKISEDSFVSGDKEAPKDGNYGQYSEILPQNPKLGKR